MKLNQIFIVGIFILLLPLKSFSQVENNDVISDKQTVQIVYAKKNNLSVYSFIPLTDYDEFKSTQRVNRINSITGDNAMVELKGKKIVISLNPLLTNEQNLDKLLSMIIRIHGYSDYTIDK